MSGLLQSGAAVDPVIPGALVRPATIGEVWDANRVLARGDRTDAEAERLRREYEPLLAEVNADRAKRGLKPMVNPGYWQSALERRPSADNGGFDFASLFDTRVDRDQQERAIFDEIGAIRRRNPGFLKDAPTDLATFRRGVIDREKAARAGARDVLGRSSGFTQGAVGFAAGTWETMHDPVNIVSLPLGGGGGTIWAQAARSALVNGGLELIQQPIVAENREDLGEELTVGEAGLNTLMAAAGGVVGDVVIPQLGKATVKGVGKAVDAFTPLDRKVAAALSKADLDGVSDADLASVFGRHVSPDLRTPDESAAIHVIEREAEIRASSPYVETPEGLDAHAARMQATMEALVKTNTPDAAPMRAIWPAPGRARLRVSGGRLANDVVSFFRGKGYSEAHARGIAAGVAAEASSNHGAVNPTSGAYGLGQWLGTRKEELFKRYGRNPTRQQQLEFLHWELQGGDHGGAKVLAQADEAGVLRAYVNDFMRPAKGAETTGDLSRGMAALGREGEDVARALDIDPEIDGPIARSPDLDAERVAIGGPDRIDAPADLLEIDYADLPQLRHDLFGDDASWQAAQLDLVDRAVSRDAAALDLPDDFTPGLPAPDGGETVRLYRAQGDLSASRQGIDTTEDALWFTTDPAIAANYASRRNGEVFAMDVPKERAAELLRGGSTANVPLAETSAMRQFTDLATVRRDAMRDGVVPTPDDVAAHVREKLPTINTDRPSPAAASPAVRDAVAGERLDGAPVLSPDAPRQLDLFAEPHGEGAKLQADSLAHDMRAAIEAQAAGADLAFRLDDGSEASLSDILADLDEDEAMLATIKGCL
ncbi:phage tail tip lysozyme [Sphingobium sp. LSP13-1-1.1]|uniref:phage tail tip lysozyme n=1 Tax=Sphingobium sp. LSP13-1-1.1 TaxID=3135234 RepID=UPI003448E427